MKDDIGLFSGNANPKLAQDIAKCLRRKAGSALVSTFSEGEIRVKIDEDVRGRDVFVLQPTCQPVNNNLMELLILIDALRRASARRITAVLPYYGYARQDRKDQPRVPITAKLVANLITTAGADRVLTMDLHAGQIQGFFDIPVDHLFAAPVLTNYFNRLSIKKLVVVSPDVGGIKMARAYAKRMRADLAIVDKRRIDDKKTQVMNILGDVRGKNAVIVDDLIATGGSLIEAAEAIRGAGARDVYAACTHPVLSGSAIEDIEASPISELVVTDTIPLPQGRTPLLTSRNSQSVTGRKSSKIRVLTIAPLLAEAIRRIHCEESVSSLFE